MIKFFYNRLLFLIIWLSIIIIHTVFLTIACNLNLSDSVVDSIIFNSIFLIAGIGVWFVVRYTNLFKNSTFDLILNHITFASIFVITWMFLSSELLKILIPSTDYHLFLKHSIVYRSIIGFLLYISMVLFFYLRQNLESFKQRIEFESNMNNMLKESQLQVLRSQINPHFLFNSLNSLNSLIVSNSEKASEMLVELSDYMRYSINSINEQFTSLSYEISQVERYVSIEKIRFENRLVFEIDVCSDCNEIKIPSMLLQPLIENAIKHGLYSNIEGVNINLKIYKEINWLFIEISNNFCKDKTSPKGTGLGIRNIQDRLVKLFGMNDLFQISIENNTFNAKIRIPIK